MRLVVLALLVEHGFFSGTKMKCFLVKQKNVESEIHRQVAQGRSIKM